MALKFLNDGYFAGKVGIGTESPTAKLHVSTGSSGATVYSGYNDMVIEGGNGASLSFLTPDANPVDINFGTPSSQFAAGIRAGYNSGTEFIAFKVVDSEKMRIIDTGNVGIGTASPAQKLEVVGNIKVIESGQTPDVSVFHSDGSYAKLRGQGLFLSRSTSYVAPVADNFGSLAVGYNGARWGNVEINAATVKFENGANEFMRISSSGNVGIGTTSPGEKLDLAGTNVGVKINGTQSSRVYYNRSGTYTWSTGLRSGDTKFHIFDERTGDRVIIDDAGNVGIGTTTPTARLDVRLSAATGRVAELHNNTGYGIGFTVEGDGGVNTINSESNQALAFATNGASNERMRITTGGDVGIGTTSPDYQLEVENTSAQATVGITGGNTDARLHLKNNEGTWLIQNDYSNTGALSFYNSTHRVVITEGGNVGIGTTSPGAKLTIADPGGSTTRSIQIEGNNSVTGMNGVMGYFSNGLYLSNNYYYNSAQVHPVSTYGQTNIVCQTGAATGYNYITFNVSDHTDPNNAPDARMRIMDSGNVGIGTASPASLLHIQGSTYHRVETFFDGSYTSGWKFSDLNGGIKYDAGSDNLVVFSNFTGTGAKMTFETQGSEKMRIDSGGNVGIGTTSPTAKLHVAGTGLFTGLVSGITPVNAANFVTKAYVDGSGGGTGPFLPLAGGTMTGNVKFNDNVFVKFGNQPDFEIGHDASNSYITHSGVGNLIIQNTEDNADIIFKSDNGSGGVTEYFRLDGGSTMNVFSKPTWHGDGVKSFYGNSQDLEIFHDGSNSYVSDTGAGSLILTGTDLQLKSAGDEFFMYGAADGQVALYHNGTKKFETGSTSVTVFGNINFGDSHFIGDDTDDNLLIQSSANENVIINSPDDDVLIRTAGTTRLQITNTNATFAGSVTIPNYIYHASDPNTFFGFDNNDQVAIKTSGNYNFFGDSTATTLYAAGGAKLKTTHVSVGTATTAGGTLIDGWKTTTQANAINDTTIATTAYVNNKIGLIPAGLVFQGTWNAATNTPTLTSGSGTTGNFYIVSTPGNTNLDGITDWKTGDWAVFIEQGASDQWEKIDNSSVLDGFGTGGSVAGWAGSGTSNTLTNAPITFSGSNVTIPGTGQLILPDGSVSAPSICNIGDTNTGIYWPSDNQLGFSVNGSRKLYMSSTGAFFQNLSSGVNINAGGINVTGNSTFTGNVTAPGLVYNASTKYLSISHWSSPPTPAAMLHLSDNSNDLDVPQIRIEGRDNPGDTRLDIAVKDADVRFNLVEGNTDASNGYGKMHFKTNANANSSNPTRGGFLFQTGAGSVIDALTITNEGNSTFTGIVETNKIFVAKGQNLSHTPSSIKISQENTTKSQIRFYGADTSTAGILEFVGSTSNGSASGVRLTINSSGNATFTGTSSALTVIARDNLFVDAGQLYIGADNGSTDGTFRQVVNTGAGSFTLQKRISGTFTNILSFDNANNATFTGKATSPSTVSTDGATTLVTKNYVDSSAGNPSHFRQGHKSHNLTNAFTTCLTVSLSNHTSCYVTVCCFGDWGSHSAAAYRGEFFLQNGANSYNEPGIILRQDDNTSNSGDQIVCQILDPTSTANPKNFEIQIRTTATTGTTGFTGLLTFTVQGQFNSVT